MLHGANRRGDYSSRCLASSCSAGRLARWLLHARAARAGCDSRIAEHADMDRPALPEAGRIKTRFQQRRPMPVALEPAAKRVADVMAAKGEHFAARMRHLTLP